MTIRLCLLESMWGPLVDEYAVLANDYSQRAMIHMYIHVCMYSTRDSSCFSTLVIVESLCSRLLCRMHDVAGVVALSGLLSVIVPSVALPRTNQQATIPSP